MLWVLPLEPLEERYTEQWYRWFSDTLAGYDKSYDYVTGETITETVEDGKVLDASGTIYYKATQLKRVANDFKHGMIKSGDKFFLFDGQFPGVESIRYMAELYGVEIEIYSYFHASSYTKEDFTEPMTPWLCYFERAWFYYYDKVFVGTNYHKEAILKRRFMANEKEIQDKIIVTGSMYDCTEILEAKDNDKFKYEKPTIIWPNRFDVEKRPAELLNLAEQHPEWNFVICTSRKKLTTDPKCEAIVSAARQTDNIIIHEGLTKKQYYEIMSRCHVYLTTSIEENFGICLLEAITLGLHPVARKGLSHSELLKNRKDCLFTTTEEMEELIEKALNHPQVMPKQLYLRYDWSIDRMLVEMGLISEDNVPKHYRKNCVSN